MSVFYKSLHSGNNITCVPLLVKNSPCVPGDHYQVEVSLKMISYLHLGQGHIPHFLPFHPGQKRGHIPYFPVKRSSSLRVPTHILYHIEISSHPPRTQFLNRLLPKREEWITVWREGRVRIAEICLTFLLWRHYEPRLQLYGLRQKRRRNEDGRLLQPESKSFSLSLHVAGLSTQGSLL